MEEFCAMSRWIQIVQGSSEANNNVVGGGLKPNLVEGRVGDSGVPVQKHPHPEGQIGTDHSNEFQHEMCVTCEQLRHVLERPADKTIQHSELASNKTK